jgi:hypothetical protein
MDIASILDRQIGNYFRDQQDRNREQITTTQLCEVQLKTKSNTTYMKIYMQNRRKDKTLRNKERANERCAKRLAREDEDFKKRKDQENLMQKD